MGKIDRILLSERKVRKGNVVVYHDTIERKPNEVIAVWNPYAVRFRAKHVKLQNNLAQKEKMMKLTPDEKVLVFCLSYYLDWETNIVVGDGEIGEKGVPLKASDIDKICGLERHRRRKAMLGLIEKNIIAYAMTEHRRKAYIMNPYWALNGRNPQESLLNTFASQTDVDDEQELV